MQKKQIPGQTLKELLKARAEERLHSFILEDNDVRGSIAVCTQMIREMQLNHNTDPVETMLLGHAYIAGALLCATLKGEDRIAFKITTDGCIESLYVEAGAHGDVRGHIKMKDPETAVQNLNKDISSMFGEGILSVIKYPEKAKTPYTGQVKITYKSIALDLANYFKNSEQTPTVFNLSISFDETGAILGAGGMFLQLLPDAKSSTIDKLEDKMYTFPSIGKEISENVKAKDLIMNNFKDFSPNILSNKRVEFFCPCNKQKISDILAALETKSLEKAVTEEDAIEIRCHNCNTLYKFSKDEIREIIRKKADKHKEKSETIN